jgi:adenine-specific DNA-methyltransferase
VKKQPKTAIHHVDYYKMPLVTGKTFKEKQNNIAGSLKNITYKSIPIKTEHYTDKTFHFNVSDTLDILSNIERIGNYKLKETDVANGIHHHHADVNKERLKVLGDKFKLGDGIFTLSNAEKLKLNLSDAEKTLLKPEYTTKQLERYYGNPHNTHWVIYTDSRFNQKNSMDNYPNLKKHLDKFQQVLTTQNAPYGLNRARDENFFKGEKIFSLRKCVGRPKFTYTDFDAYVSAAFYVIKPQDIDLKYLTGILNSKLVAFYLKHRGKMQGSNYQIDKAPLLNIPIVIANSEMQEKLIDYVISIQDAKLVYHSNNTEFLEFLQLDFSLKKISKKLMNWYELSLQDFFDELKSQVKDISKAQAVKWCKEFEEKQETLISLKDKIPKIDSQIDQIVYEIYGLTADDMTMIEGEYS